MRPANPICPEAPPRGGLSRPLCSLFCVLALLPAGSRAAGAAQDAAPRAGYRQTSLPVLEKHCLEWHGALKAKAGFRIDLLGTDFTAANVADHWKEALDRVNAGEMPPNGSPRPGAEQTAAFVGWVNGRL